MNLINFSKDIKIYPCLSVLSTAASATRTSEVIDTIGYDSLCVVYHNGTMAAGADTTLKLSMADAASDENTLTSAVDVTGSAQTLADTDDDVVRFIDVPKVQKRYYQLTATKDAANVSDEAAIAYLYNGKSAPATHAAGGTGAGTGTGAVTGEIHVGAIGGTA